MQLQAWAGFRSAHSRMQTGTRRTPAPCTGCMAVGCGFRPGAGGRSTWRGVTTRQVPFRISTCNEIRMGRARRLPRAPAFPLTCSRLDFSSGSADPEVEDGPGNHPKLTFDNYTLHV